MGPRFSIRYKILSVVTALLVSALGLYVLLASRIFRQDKTELIFDLNKSVVTTLSTEVETSLRGASDKLKLFAALTTSDRASSSRSALKNIVEHDPQLVRLELYEMGNSKSMRLVSDVGSEDFNKLYGILPSYYDERLSELRPIPFAKIQAESVYVWNATLSGGPALVGIGLSVIRETPKGVPEKMMAAIGYLKADTFLENLKGSNLTQAFIVDSQGKTLVHPKSELMLHEFDFSTSPIVKELKKNSFPNGVLEYKDAYGDQLGAYAHVRFGGLGIVSQVESHKAFAAVRSLVTRSLLFALIIITATFIATVFFSRSLISPLQKLLSAMEKVAQGNLDTEVNIKSRDEIALLSSSFNQMTKDLKVSRVQLEEINRDLESKVSDRTRKLEEQNRAVKEAQEALLRTTRLASVGEIAGRTAHEVLNPLTSLMTRIQKIQKKLNDEIVEHKDLMSEIVQAWDKEYKEQGSEGLMKALQKPSSINPKLTLLQEDLQNINSVLLEWDKDLENLGSDTQFLFQQAGRIEKILNQMRSLSVVSSSKTQLQAGGVIKDAMNIVADLFAKNKIELKENFTTKQDQISVDRDELIQVLTNLLRNSLQSICENSSETLKGTVTVKTHIKAKRFFIDIIDNGGGILPANQSKLFESQFTTKSKDQGTGLGLNISRRFIRNFNGDLYLVNSRPLEETVFRIDLPLAGTSQAEVAA